MEKTAFLDELQDKLEALLADTPAADLQRNLKALLVQQLVQHSLDDGFPPAQRVQCLKLLGSLFEVQAFTEHKTVETVQSSHDIRARLIETLTDVTDVETDDVAQLLAEIRQPADIDSAEPELLDGDTD